MNQSSQLHDLITSAGSKLVLISESDMSAKPAPEKWSKKEILGHLIDSAYNNHRRFIQSCNQDTLVFDGYDQALWVKANQYQGRKASEIIEAWVVANRHIAGLIESLPSELLVRETTNHNFHMIGMRPVAEGSTSSLGYLIDDYIFHIEHHLAQIISTD